MKIEWSKDRKAVRINGGHWTYSYLAHYDVSYALYQAEEREGVRKWCNSELGTVLGLNDLVEPEQFNPADIDFIKKYR